MARFAVDGARVVFDDGGMNLLSTEALEELRGIVWSAADPSALFLHFKSGRPGLFAAGADMSEMQRFTPAQARDFAELGQSVFEALEKLPYLTVAEIDGDCFGGALDLALAFDFRFATPRSRFSHPGARLGIATGFGGTSRWRKVVGRPAANALFLKNAVLTADEALNIGLVDAVANDHTESIERLKAVDPATARFVKELTIHSARLSRSELQLLAERLGHLYFAR